MADEKITKIADKLEGAKLLRIDAVAQYLGCSKRHVYSLMKKRRLATVRISKRGTRVPAAEVLRFLEANRIEAEGGAPKEGSTP